MPLPFPTPSQFAAVILAAGASTRMGRAKQLLLLENKSLLARTIEAALSSPLWPVVVVLGANAEQIRPAIVRYPVLIAENPAWAEGMASSIREGLSTVRQFSRALEGVVIALCDQPAFSDQVVNRLLATQRSSGRSIVAARYGERNAVPALFLRRHFSTLAALTGEAGARALLNDPDGDVASVELPELAVDLDTMSDYERQPGAVSYPKDSIP